MPLPAKGAILKTRTVIVGAGISGLSTAFHLGHECLLLEQNDRPGGLCHTVRRNGFLFDNPGHVLHADDASCARLVDLLGRDAFAALRRRAFVYTHGTYTHYPFQTSLHGLPPEVVNDCVSGFREAASGDPACPARSFRDWALAAFGPGIARHFLFPYTRKLFGRPPEELTADWAERFIPRPALDDVLRGAAAPRASDIGYHARLFYPRSGGIQTLPRLLAARLPAPPRLGAEVVAVELDEAVVVLSDGARLPYRHLVSTMPLPELVRRLRPLPPAIADAAAALRHVSVLNYNLAVARRPLFEGHWIYFPEPAFPFYRVGFPGRISPETLPAAGDTLHAEIAFHGAPPDETALREDVRAGLRQAGLLRSGDVVLHEGFTTDPYAYVVYDHERRAATETLHGLLAEHDIYSIGRYGRWEYSTIGDAFAAGRDAAERIRCRTRLSKNRMPDEIVEEPIAVTAGFARGAVTPTALTWAGREHSLSAVHARWVTLEGAGSVRHFSVEAASGDLFHIAFYTESMTWRLERVLMP
jgi:protoporphyrinogen oxidase